METRREEKEWYDSPNLITTMLIVVILLSILLSQSFAIRNHLDTATILRSILNHNSLYLIMLVYFAFLKTKIGRRYFHILNVLLSLFFCLITIASIFTIFQSFGLTSLVDLALNIVLTIYFIYVFIRDTVMGKDLNITKAPMDEVNNNQYFYGICGIILVALVVSLIGSSTFDGVVLALLDAIYYVLFARYIFLYKEFQDKKKKVKQVEKKKSEKEKSISKEETVTLIQDAKEKKPSRKIEEKEKGDRA